MPFAGYKNFADCVRKNRNKRDPQAYCASIMRHTEEDRGKVESEEAAKETPPRSGQHTGFWKGHI